MQVVTGVSVKFDSHDKETNDTLTQVRTDGSTISGCVVVVQVTRGGEGKWWLDAVGSRNNRSKDTFTWSTQCSADNENKLNETPLFSSVNTAWWWILYMYIHVYKSH